MPSKARVISGGTSFHPVKSGSNRPSRTGSPAALRPCPTNTSSFRCRSEPLHPAPANARSVSKVNFMTTMLASDLPLPRIGRGKVRDIYSVGDDRVLLLTTDRISAFDIVMAEPIPMEGAVPHHMISADADSIIRDVPALKDHRASLLGRAMLCKRTKVFPIECVIRGYLSCSAWKEYAASGTLAGEELPKGLLESGKLEPAIFSPATKAESGHDENITVGRMREVVGAEVTDSLESMTRAVYTRGEKISRD